MHPIKDDGVIGGYRYEHNPEGETYSRNSDGWKDLYNFQDIALSELENAEFLAGVRLDNAEPITYGPFSEEGQIWDYYPYWCGWVSFSIVCGVPYKKSEALRDLLN